MPSALISASGSMLSVSFCDPWHRSGAVHSVVLHSAAVVVGATPETRQPLLRCNFCDPPPALWLARVVVLLRRDENMAFFLVFGTGVHDFTTSGRQV